MSRYKIPRVLADYLPYIWLGLIRLHQSDVDVDWVTTSRDEEIAQPYADLFEERVLEKIQALSELHSKSKSCIMATALTLYRNGPKQDDYPSGLKRKPEK